MINLVSYKEKLIFLLLFISLGLSLYAQGQSNRTIYIQNKLLRIDSLIKIKQFDKAVTIINNTKNTFSFKVNDEDKLALDYRYAQILHENDDKEKALEKLLHGFEKLKLNSDSPLFIQYLNLISRIFANNQNFDKAIYYSKKSLNKSIANKDTLNITISLVRIGSFYYAKNELDSAKLFFRKVTYYPLTEKTEKRLSNAYNNLGVIAQSEDNYNLAKAYAKKALEIRIKQKDTVGIAASSVNLGNLYHYQKNYKEAIKNYERARLSLVKDSSNAALNVKRAIFDNLSVSYDSLEDYKKAYEFLLQYSKINKKIHENTLSKNIAETEAKYNLAREEQKTELQKNKALKAQILFYSLAFLTIIFFILAMIFYKNYKLKQQNKLEQIHSEAQTRIINATIDAKEKERKTIAEILHDSVSALLSSANLHLQASKAQLNLNAPVEITKAQQIVMEASVKIRNLSHELISSVLLKFGLAFAVHDMCEKYSNSEFTLMSDDSGIKRYNQEFEIKIYSIIEELINNVIKHSQAKNASINLVERKGEKLLIQIMDDGIGFDVKKARKKDGLGLSHIEARVKVMRGVFNINSKKDEGTSIFISVPIYKKKDVEKV